MFNFRLNIFRYTIYILLITSLNFINFPCGLIVNGWDNWESCTNMHELQYSHRAKCHCPDGYTAVNNEHCEDINDCTNLKNEHSCTEKQVCINIKGSYRCECKNGYHVLSEIGGNSCQDINECLEGEDKCEQTCINAEGSYTCDCIKGYILESDKLSCKIADTRPPLLIYSTGNIIKYKYLGLNNTGSISYIASKKVTSLTFDPITSNVFWVEGGQLIYHKSLTNKEDPQAFPIIGQPMIKKISMDYFGMNLYVLCKASKTNTSFILACPLKLLHLSTCLTVVETHDDSIESFELDFLARIFIWSSTSGIHINTMDGSSTYSFFQHNETNYSSDMIFTVDIPSTNAYFIDLNRINSWKYKNITGKKVPNELLHRGYNNLFLLHLFHPAKAKIWEDYIYVSFKRNKGIYKFNKKSGEKDGKENVISENETDIGDWNLFHQTMVTQVQNPCSPFVFQCSHICLLKPATLEDKLEYRCACPDGQKLSSDGHTCLDKCMINNGGCTHICSTKRDIVSCTCHEGFELYTDGRTCNDINECLNNDQCHHKCINKPGTYECSCHQGYILDRNGATCKEKDGDGPVFLIVHDNTTSAICNKSLGDRDLSPYVPIMLPPDVNILDVKKSNHVLFFYDRIDEKIYILDGLKGILFRKFFKRKKWNTATLLTENWHLKSMSIDSIVEGCLDDVNKNLYLVEPQYLHKRNLNHRVDSIFVQTKLQVYNLVTHSLVDLINLPGRKIEHIEFSTLLNIMVTCEVHLHSDHGNTSIVVRKPDGHFEKSLIEGKKLTCFNLIVDEMKSRVFWIDSSTNTIRSIHIASKELNVVAKNEIRSQYLALNRGNLIAYRQNLNGSFEMVQISLRYRNISHIWDCKHNYSIEKIIPFFKSKVQSSCKKAGCEHVCIPKTRHSHVCKCEKGFYKITTKCIPELEIDLNSEMKGNCSNNPCKYGRCESHSNNYFICWCSLNYKGALCDIPVNRNAPLSSGVKFLISLLVIGVLVTLFFVSHRVHKPKIMWLYIEKTYPYFGVAREFITRRHSAIPNEDFNGSCQTLESLNKQETDSAVVEEFTLPDSRNV